MRAKRISGMVVLGLILWLGAGILSPAQVQRVGAGLEFATGYEFNSVSVGNPGFKVKTWVTLDPKRQNLHLVPTLSVFNKNRMNGGLFYVTNYMFMGDLDGQYTVYRDRTLQMAVFAGVDFTYLNSVVEQADPIYPIPEHAPGNLSDYAFGGNIGGALELRMAHQWDMNVSVKYIVSNFSQFIISVEGVYYFKTRRKRRR